MHPHGGGEGKTTTEEDMTISQITESRARTTSTATRHGAVQGKVRGDVPKARTSTAGHQRMETPSGKGDAASTDAAKGAKTMGRIPKNAVGSGATYKPPVKGRSRGEVDGPGRPIHEPLRPRLDTGEDSGKEPKPVPGPGKRGGSTVDPDPRPQPVPGPSKPVVPLPDPILPPRSCPGHDRRFPGLPDGDSKKVPFSDDAPEQGDRLSPWDAIQRKMVEVAHDVPVLRLPIRQREDAPEKSVGGTHSVSGGGGQNPPIGRRPGG
jgi:hypothetical protein